VAPPITTTPSDDAAVFMTPAASLLTTLYHRGNWRLTIFGWALGIANNNWMALMTNQIYQ